MTSSTTFNRSVHRRRLSALTSAGILGLGTCLISGMASRADAGATAPQVPPMLLDAPGTLASRVAETVEKICNPDPPDYPGCSVAQVNAIAKGDADTWYRRIRFGQTADVLNAAGLTAAQQERVRAALRGALVDHFRASANRAVARGRADSTKVWTTNWRGVDYPIQQFPYKRYLDYTLEGGGRGSDYGACWVGHRTSFYDVAWAFQYCKANLIPSSWEDYWKPMTEELDKPSDNIDLPCKKEIIMGAAMGAAGGGWVGLAGGPAGVFLGAVNGAEEGTVVGIAACAIGNLGEAWGWWDYSAKKSSAKTLIAARPQRLRNDGLVRPGRSGELSKPVR